MTTTDPSGHPQPPSSSIHLPLWPLVLITFSGTSAMHMFVPALPNAAQALGADTALVQLTISIYILGLALGMLVCGPLADGFGRRPVLLAGLALFTAGGLAACVAPNVQVLLVARLFQALGGCTGLLMPRTMLRDTADSTVTIRRLALLNLITSVGPGLSPVVGAGVADLLSWRFIFVLLTLLGGVNLWLVWKRLPETRRPARRPGVARVLRDYASLLASPRFRGYALGGGLATTSGYAYIVAAPFIFVGQLHRPVHEVGIYLALNVVAAASGSWLSGRLVARVGLDRLVLWASGLSVASAVLYLAVAYLVGPTLWGVLLLAGLITLGAGTCGPLVSVQVMNIRPELSGSASGLFGFLQMSIGALCTAAASVFRDATLGSGWVLLITAALAQWMLQSAARATR